MYEKFVEGKTLSEKEAILDMDNVSEENVLRSSLSDFSKNFILYDFRKDLNKDELISRVEKSNKLYFNYAIRPKWTLLNFLFSNFESRPPGEILKKLKVFPFYKFYADSISDFIKDNFQIFITKNEITSIIDETNNIIHEKLTNDISGLKIKNFFLYLFKLKYDDESEINLESTLPYSFIKIFLNDKSYSGLDKKFDVIRDLTDESEISLKDIIKVLNDKYNLNESVKINVDKIVGSPKEMKKIIDVPLPEKEPEEVKEKVVPVKSEESEIEPKVIPERGSEPIYSKELSEAVNEESGARIESTVQIAEDDGNELYKLFDDKLLRKILNKVYSSDESYRDESFEKLIDYRTWDEASDHLREIFLVNNVNLYNKDVIRFVNTLNEYFQTKE